jgi:putative ABC transport system permease protein
LYVRFNPGATSEITDIIQKDFKQFFPSQSFEYTFLDDRLNSLYASETKLSETVGFFAALAIFIASLGIFGLSLYTVQQRVKEIGIRKVLGATTFNIATVVSKEFLKPILIAIVISIPVSWLIMNKWLEGFAYRIDIQWWIFLIAGTMALLIALVTTSFQATKAAMADPVESLRTE